MTNDHYHLLALVRSSFSPPPQVLLSYDLDELMMMASSQAIQSLILDGLQRHFESYSVYRHYRDDTVDGMARRMQWVGQVVATERLYAKHEKAMAGLARLYAAKGLRMMVLKGYGLSLDWPVPNHRVMGDLDIYNFGK